MSLSEEILDLISCPKCNSRLKERGESVVCIECKKRFPIEDGVPNLLE
ncbi:MAG: Trm112 family protein [Nanoarchaeota archaeon]|nr:Trm112 family protein [Nanoarchaeota archaeon]MBU4123914.1 Trm112 family protein [Nanoarchaeota archaeon]